jgi:hypothetical protein
MFAAVHDGLTLASFPGACFSSFIARKQLQDGDA